MENIATRLLAISWLLLGAGAFAEDGKKLETAQSPVEIAWNTMLAMPNPQEVFGPGKECTDSSSDGVSEEGWQYFDELQMTFSRGLDQAESEERVEEFARGYIDRFGRDGPEADLKWALAAAPLVLIDSYVDENTIKPHRRYKSVETMNATASAFWRSLTEKCLASSDFYRRWTHLNLYLSYSIHKGAFPAYYLTDEIPDSPANLLTRTRWLLFAAKLTKWDVVFKDFQLPLTAEWLRAKQNEIQDGILGGKPSQKALRGWVRDECEYYDIYFFPELPSLTAFMFASSDQPMVPYRFCEEKCCYVFLDNEALDLLASLGSEKVSLIAWDAERNTYCIASDSEKDKAEPKAGITREQVQRIEAMSPRSRTAFPDSDLTVPFAIRVTIFEMGG